MEALHSLLHSYWEQLVLQARQSILQPQGIPTNVHSAQIPKQGPILFWCGKAALAFTLHNSFREGIQELNFPNYARTEKCRLMNIVLNMKESGNSENDLDYAHSPIPNLWILLTIYTWNLVKSLFILWNVIGRIEIHWTAEHHLDEAEYCHGGAEYSLDVTSERRRQHKAGSCSTKDK